MNLPNVEFISTPLYVRLSCGYLPWQADFFLPFYSHYGPKPPAKTTTFLRGYFEVAFSRFLLRLCVDQGFEKPYVLGVSRFMSMDVPANGFA